jgi:serine phosphatase RsbU (regulator of sigma subunit)
MKNAAQEGDPELTLRSLVAHAESVPVSTTVESLQAVFAQKGVEFLAVLDGKRLLGICSRRQLTQQLSSRFGFALLARQAVSAFLMAAPMMVSEETPITAVFQTAALRDAQEFYDDVLLVDRDRCYLGMIPMRTLVRLQTEFLIRNNSRLEASREEIATKNRIMEEDLLMAREMQLAMQPQAHVPLSAHGLALNLAHRYQPATGVSGDFFDVLRISNDAAGLLVCDVMGHGVRSALITAMVRAMLEELRPIAADPGTLLTHLNRDLTRILRHAGGLIFVTAAYAVIQLDIRRLLYAQAGHPTPFRWNAITREVRPLKCPLDYAGPALGLIDDFEFKAVEESFAAGDRLALFTDGIFEAANPDGEEFGLHRLEQILARVGGLPLNDALDAVFQEVAHFSGGAFADDVCVIAAEVNPIERTAVATFTGT